MNSATANANLTRDIAEFLVEEEEQATGSLMTAYWNVAKAAGTSSSWMRKFVKKYEAKELGWTAGWNLLDYFQENYCRVCDRVELRNEARQTKIDALKERTNATYKIIAEMSVARAAGQESTTRTRAGATASELADQA